MGTSVAHANHSTDGVLIARSTLSLAYLPLLLCCPLPLSECLLLDLAAKYTPKDENSVFDIMNLLEDRLKHSNSAVVLGTTKVFLNYTLHMPRVNEEVYKRLKAPLLTLMTGGSHELSFSILAHIHILVQKYPLIFADSFKHFFVRFNDPSSVKMQKLNIITQLATQGNMTEILGELSEYVTDIDADISRFAIRAIGRISIRIPAAAEESIEHLLAFLDLHIDHVTSETVIVLKDFLRKYPERFEEIIPSLTRVLRSIEEPEGKIACIWMVGEYGETISEAPYILEGLIESFPEEQDSLVKMELLTATTKLFFKRPPELKEMLARLLKMAINTQANGGAAGAGNAGGKIVHIDVRDRALLYYRLLQFDVHEAARVVNSAKKAAAASSAAAAGASTIDGGRSLLFAEQVDLDLYAKIFAEFNSLSVVYHTPQERFVKAPVYDEEEEKKREAEELAKAEAETASAALTGGAAKDASAAAEESEDILPSGALGGVSSSPSQPAAAPATPARGAGGEVDLLGDFMSSLEVSSPVNVAASAPALQFLPGQTLDKATYQSKWGSLAAAGPPVELAIKSRPITSALIEQLLSSSANIITFASGGVGNMIKFFLFGRDVSLAAKQRAEVGEIYIALCLDSHADLLLCSLLCLLVQSSSLYLMEMNVDTVSGRLVATIKTDAPNAATTVPVLQGIIKSALAPLC